MIWVLIDASYLAHRARHCLGGLTFDDFHTGVLFGFLEQLLTTCQSNYIQSNKVAFFFDSKQSFRKQAYPEYKKKRHEDRTEEEIQQLTIMHEQVKLLRTTFLPGMGFKNLYRQTGLESDDLLAQAALEIENDVDMRTGIITRGGVIITSDKDLCQCISTRVHWYDPQRNNYLNGSSLRANYGVGPTDWARMKAIAGCNSDNVEGIRGVGDKTAGFYIEGNLNPKTKKFQSIVCQEGQDIIERNMPLVKLPHVKTKAINLQENEFYQDQFFDLCRQYGIESYLDGRRYKDWVRFFRGRFDRQKDTARRRDESR